jgi:hypothetical protein
MNCEEDCKFLDIVRACIDSNTKLCDIPYTIENSARIKTIAKEIADEIYSLSENKKHENVLYCGTCFHLEKEEINDKDKYICTAESERNQIPDDKLLRHRCMKYLPDAHSLYFDITLSILERLGFPT